MRREAGRSMLWRVLAFPAGLLLSGPNGFSSPLCSHGLSPQPSPCIRMPGSCPARLLLRTAAAAACTLPSAAKRQHYRKKTPYRWMIVSALFEIPNQQVHSAACGHKGARRGACHFVSFLLWSTHCTLRQLLLLSHMVSGNREQHVPFHFNQADVLSTGLYCPPGMTSRPAPPPPLTVQGTAIDIFERIEANSNYSAELDTRIMPGTKSVPR